MSAGAPFSDAIFRGDSPPYSLEYPDLPAIKSAEVIQLPSIDSSQFVEAVQPLLECKDLQGLHKLLKSRWTLPQLISFLGCDDDDVRKVAALALAYVGGKCCINAVSSQLHHPDPVVNQMAEHAL